jgi:hypothetical protein
MNLGSRQFAYGLWRVESVDAHFHMTCVRLYAVMAIDFDDAFVIHSCRIHGDMLGVLPSDSWQSLEAHGRSGSLAAWHAARLSARLPGAWTADALSHAVQIDGSR